MSRLRAAVPGGLRVILCLKFAQGAPFHELAQMKHALLQDENVLHSVEVSGSYDFMAEMQLADLGAYQAMLDEFAERFGQLIEHYEASFICRRFVREPEAPAAHFWVPTASGMQRLDHDRINRITAEGDYVRLHGTAGSWLLHSTMRKVVEQLDSHRFIQLSRSLVVRTDYIERLIHYYRRWAVRLFDQSEHIIAKSRTARVLSELRAESSIAVADQPESRESNENLVHPAESRLH